MKILFLVPYPLKESPSQRFRFEQYIDSLQTVAQIEFQSFLSAKNWRVFYKSGNITGKAIALILGFFKRLIILPRCRHCDYIFIHREATPIGPPFVEWIIAKVLNKKMIFDFDDAIWLTDNTHETSFARFARNRSKVGRICSWSHKVSCGNEYLAAFARKFNQNVILNPTTIDTINLHNPTLFEKNHNDIVTIGWTGSHTTLKYLESLAPIIQELEKRHPIRFLVIADRDPLLGIKTQDFIKWSADSEIQDLLKIDIGVMPLPDDEWSHGKCGFKILQYMALGIPSVASPVGVNKEIIFDGKSGFLCSSSHEWIESLERLIEDRSLRIKMGEAGRDTVERQYSVISNTNNFLNLFTSSRHPVQIPTLPHHSTER